MIDLLEKLKIVILENSDKVFFDNQNESITYGKLFAKALKYSELLQKQGSSPIIVYGHKSVNMVISIIACLLARRTYVPIDTYMPKKRISKIISLSKADLLIANEKIMINNIDICTLEELDRYQELQVKDNNNNIAYIIFTSGSTGNPKGVPISYDNLKNFIHWISNIQPLCEYKNNIVFNQASFSFDLSVADFYYSLYNGHTLETINKTDNNYLEIYEILVKKKINTMIITPTFMKLCLINNDFNYMNYRDLKCIYFCGEMLEVQLAKELFKRFPTLKIINAYGPTEATSAVSSILITKDMLDKEILPVGEVDKWATKIEIINNEIVLKGPSVFSGYLDNIKGGYYREGNINCYHTGDIGFIKDNLLYCKGRMDNQIKYKGYRIELNDIENNIKSIKGVIDVIVIPKKNEHNIIRFLKAFIIKNESINLNDLKCEIENILPKYMIPKNIQIVDRFPVTKNGKIDREKLSEL